MTCKIPENASRDMTAIAETIVAAAERMLSAHDIEQSAHSKPGDANYVTTYDLAIQNLIVDRLHEAFPDARFLCEESAAAENALPYTVTASAFDPADGVGYFVIDPIDGTTNFIHSSAHSAISIAYCRGDETVIGAIINPYKNELFCAERGQGAYLNGTRFKASDRHMREGLALVGTSPYSRELTDRTMRLIRAVFDASQDIRRSGSAALDICDAAFGRVAVYAEQLIAPWDFAAGMCIAKEAGCVVSALDGSPTPPYKNTPMLVGCPTAHAEAVEILKTI